MIVFVGSSTGGWYCMIVFVGFSTGGWYCMIVFVGFCTGGWYCMIVFVGSSTDGWQGPTLTAFLYLPSRASRQIFYLPGPMLHLPKLEYTPHKFT